MTGVYGGADRPIITGMQTHDKAGPVDVHPHRRGGGEGDGGGGG